MKKKKENLSEAIMGFCSPDVWEGNVRNLKNSGARCSGAAGRKAEQASLIPVLDGSC